MSETLKLPTGYDLLLETSADNGRGDITWRLRRMFGPNAPMTIGYFSEKSGATKNDAIQFAIEDLKEIRGLWSDEPAREPAPEPTRVAPCVAVPKFYPVSFIDDSSHAVVIMERGDEKLIIYGRTATYEAERIADRLGGVA